LEYLKYVNDYPFKFILQHCGPVLSN